MEFLPEILSAFDAKKAAIRKQLADLLNNPSDVMAQQLLQAVENPREKGRLAAEAIAAGHPERIMDYAVAGDAPDWPGASQAGHAAQAMFVGAKANLSEKTKALEQVAMNRLFQGENPNLVRQETGWFRGLARPDKLARNPEYTKMRTEIDDSLSKATVIPRYEDFKARMAANPLDSLFLKDIFEHPELYKAYPELANTRIRIIPEGDRNWGSAYINHFGPDEHLIELRDRLPHEKARTTLLHEIQHIIQQKEGFFGGGSMDEPLAKAYAMAMANKRGTADEMDAWNWYNRLPGEVEARLTALRANMGAKDRLETDPLTSLVQANEVRPERFIYRSDPVDSIRASQEMPSGNVAASISNVDWLRSQLADYQKPFFETALKATADPEKAFAMTRQMTNLMTAGQPTTSPLPPGAALGNLPGSYP